MMLRLFVMMIALACLCVAADVYAQDVPAESMEQEAPRTRAQWVAQLADAEYARRVDATHALMRDDTLDEPALRGLLLAAEHPERRRRLLWIAEHHAMRAICADAAAQLSDQERAEDTGSVGFSYDHVTPEQNPHTGDAAVVVLATLPGFPGHAYLQPGDLILSIDGRSIRTNHVGRIRDWVGDAIKTHRPGDTVTLTVYRDDQTLDFEISCGSIKALNEIYLTGGEGVTIRQDPYDEMLNQVMARLAAGLPEPEALVPAE